MLPLFTFHRLIPLPPYPSSFLTPSPPPYPTRPFLYIFFGFFLNVEIWQEEEKGNDNKSSSSSE